MLGSDTQGIIIAQPECRDGAGLWTILGQLYPVHRADRSCGIESGLWY